MGFLSFKFQVSGFKDQGSKFKVQSSRFKVLGAKILFFDEFLGDLYIIALDLDEINA